MTNLTKSNEGIIDNLHTILAVLCYKEPSEIITMTEFNRRAELFQTKLDVTIAYPIGFFFANLSVQLLEHIQSYSILKRWKMKIKLFLMRGLKLNGDGMQLLTGYLQKKKGKTLNTSLK
jgi:poly(3-hydroxyalkanoate) synthetase